MTQPNAIGSGSTQATRAPGSRLWVECTGCWAAWATNPFITGEGDRSSLSRFMRAQGSRVLSQCAWTPTPTAELSARAIHSSVTPKQNAHGCPPTVIGYPPTALSHHLTAVGYLPSAVSYPPAAVGYPQRGVPSCPQGGGGGWILTDNPDQQTPSLANALRPKYHSPTPC